MLRVLALLAVTLAACAMPGGGWLGGAAGGSGEALASPGSAWSERAGATASWPGSSTPRALAEDEEVVEDDEGHGFLVGALLYIPNRIFDVMDIVRARVRVGPGIALGLRATELADVFVGSYMSVFAGLPGPRNRVLPKLPVGIETKSGVEASVADVTLEGPIGPDYGPAEIGISLHFLLVGIDVGFEPVEILDLVLGLVTVDIKDDDF